MKSSRRYLFANINLIWTKKKERPQYRVTFKDGIIKVYERTEDAEKWGMRENKTSLDNGYKRRFVPTIEMDSRG